MFTLDTPRSIPETIWRIVVLFGQESGMCELNGGPAIGLIITNLHLKA